jgi:hypothetical protein
MISSPMKLFQKDLSIVLLYAKCCGLHIMVSVTSIATCHISKHMPCTIASKLGQGEARQC